MSGIHDLGAVAGFGAVKPQQDEPVFDEDWKRRMFGVFVALAATGSFNGDEFRHAQEGIDPSVYIKAPYYERWYLAVQTLLAEKRILTSGLNHRALAPAEVDAYLAAGAHYRSRQSAVQRFWPGDSVIVRSHHGTGHTRAPRYARGKPGIVERHEGVFTFADSNAHGQGRQPQSLYRVRFSARDLWGSDGAPQDEVYLSLWDAHLDAASAADG